jgi:hypothetical protein
MVQPDPLVRNVAVLLAVQKGTHVDQSRLDQAYHRIKLYSGLLYEVQ